jgi:hypothetical protein
MVKPTKTKSLGQIAYETYYGKKYSGKKPFTVSAHWEQREFSNIARAVEREVLRREKVKPKKLWVKGKQGWFLRKTST